MTLNRDQLLRQGDAQVVALYWCGDCEEWCSAPCYDSRHHQRSFEPVEFVRVEAKHLRSGPGDPRLRAPVPAKDAPDNLTASRNEALNRVAPL